MSYSQAIDMQHLALRWLRSDDARAWFDACNKAGGAVEGHGWTDWNIAMRVERPLVEGVPYYWSPDLCDVIEAAAATLPDVTLRAEMLPSWAGYCRFGRTLQDRAHDYPPYLVALSWQTVEPADGGDGPATVLVTPWFTNALCPAGLPLGGASWDIGQTAALIGGHAPDDERQAAPLRWLLSLFGSMLLFMEQRVLVAKEERPARATRRRLEREGWTHEPMVRVVQLRRAAAETGRRDGAAPVEWSCRWVVSGHWRQQACGPDRAERRPVFVLPYVKGPENAPLKAPAERVFAVVR